MRKVALFVEGQAECIFVRDFLQKWYVYDDSQLGIVCYTLIEDDLLPFNRSCGNKESENFFQIINVNNDNRALGYLLDNAQSLSSKGYSLIVGLRDMFSEKYKKIVKDHTIHPEINKRFIDAAYQEIAQSAHAGMISFHYAVMEIEAWMLALLCPDGPDPEISYFHPFAEMESRRSYKKTESDVESVCSCFKKEDYISLLNSGRCHSFFDFVNALVGPLTLPECVELDESQVNSSDDGL